MRGTPFLFEGFHGGLNTIDSPYTLADNETRNCLNVVSTERGSILKRTGSVLFTPPLEVFPTTVVKDSFKRGEEKPLSNGAKWTVITGAADTGYIPGAGAETWRSHLSFPSESAARWNVEEQANPAVSIEVKELSTIAGRSFGVWCCLAEAAKSGYRVNWECAVTEGLFTVMIEKWVAGERTILATLSSTALKAGDTIGISARGEKVRAWRKTGGKWIEVTRATDATYATGYTGFFSNATGTYLNNFAYAEIPAGTNIPAEELQTLAAVEIKEEPYFIAATEKLIYAINSSGTVLKIGEGFTNGYWSILQVPKTTEVAGQGPVFMTNGVDAPQYWNGKYEAASVKPWTGISEPGEIADGVVKESASTITSETAKFVASDVGLKMTFKTVLKAKKGGAEIKEATITAFHSAKEVGLELPEGSEGWEKEVVAVKFLLNRSFYEKSPYVPKGRFMTFAGNRIWMTGIAEDEGAVWFSELASIGEGGSKADPSSWPRSNVVRFDHEDGEEISGIGTVGPYVIVFKESKTWVIHDLNTGANRKISSTIGCVSHRSIVETNNGTYFLTADQGVYLTEGSKMHEMSYNIRPTLLKINAAEREKAAAVYWNNHYYLSFPYETSNTNNRTADYDVVLKSWWLHDLTGNQWAIAETTTETPGLYAIPPGKAKGVVKCFVPNVYTDSGENYVGNDELGAWWFAPWQPFAYYIFRHRIKAPFLKKRVRQIFFDGEGIINPVVFKNFHAAGDQLPGVVGNIPETEPELPVRFSSGSEIWGNPNEEQIWGPNKEHLFQGLEQIWGGQTNVQAARIYAPGVARVWSVGWGNDSDEPFKIDSYAMMISFRKS